MRQHDPPSQASDVAGAREHGRGCAARERERYRLGLHSGMQFAEGTSTARRVILDAILGEIIPSPLNPSQPSVVLMCSERQCSVAPS
jgi:hypothetical protein